MLFDYLQCLGYWLAYSLSILTNPLLESWTMLSPSELRLGEEFSFLPPGSMPMGGAILATRISTGRTEFIQGGAAL